MVQSQVDYLEIIKGVGKECPEAKTRIDNGFLAIEDVNGRIVVVFRMLTGKAPFTGLLNKAAAKTRVLDQEGEDKGEGEFRLKFTVAVKSKDAE